MTDTLPRAIADLCGVLMGNTRKTVVQEEETFDPTNPVHLVKTDEDFWLLTYNDDVAGWIGKVGVENTNGAKYRAMSVHGEIKHVHSLQSAKEWILSNYH